MTATLRAVAKAAGVHVATASRALNARTSHLVREPTRSRVQEAAEQLDYQANVNAAALRSGRSGMVGILVPGLSNPVYAPIIAGAAEVLEGVEIGTMVADTGARRERSAALVRALAARRVDGLLMATSFEDRDLAAEQAMRRQLPLIMLNRSLPGTVAVRPDNVAGLRLVVGHLVGLGHRAIGYLGGNLLSIWRNDRREAFDLAMAFHGMQSIVAGEVPGYGREAGHEGAMRLLVQVPEMTAMVCGNDMIAIGAYDAARALGRRVPQDLSITGHNDIPFMDAVAPPLTTVRVDYRGLGRLAAGLLLRRMAGEPVEETLLPAKLMVRGSTAPPPG